jgi:hypothetical protein
MCPRFVCKRSLVRLAASFCLSALAGCSGSASGSSPAAGATTEAASASADPSSFCESFCTKNATCDSRVDAQTCTTKCDDEVASTLKRRRADIVGGAATCFEASDCHQVLSGTRLRECLDEAAVSVAPTDKVKTFCDGLVGAFERCDSHFDRAVCLDAIKVFSDATLAQGEACLDKSCSQMATCVSATFGVSSK